MRLLRMIVFPVVIFTEYRSTQAYLEKNLSARYGQGCVSLIHGGMTYRDREDAIQKFEEESQFLISTEAGGEGLNMHRQCHIMVNYDLPWNPMRLVQRIGRLYRYGQQKQVLVLNMHVPQTADARILSVMYERLDQVVSDMAPLSKEYSQGLQDELMGEIAGVLDISGILENTERPSEESIRLQIDESLKQAKAAVEMQRELFDFAHGFNPDELAGQLSIGKSHLVSFVKGMCAVKGISFKAIQNEPGVFQLEFDSAVKRELDVKHKQLNITFNRGVTFPSKGLHIMDMESHVLKWLLSEARKYEFAGLHANINGLEATAVVTSLLRWQNDQGARMRQEFAVALVRPDQSVEVNSEDVSEWLEKPAEDSEVHIDTNDAMRKVEALERVLGERLAVSSNQELHPENMQLISSAHVKL